MLKEIIDSRQLRAFVAVARGGSFTLGAKAIFVTQPAASHAIRLLEEELGCRLFDRVGKRALLTLAGEQLLQHCDRILAAMQDVRKEIGALKNWGHTRLRLGATMSACQHIIPSVLSEFKKRYPECLLRIESGDNPQLIGQLRANHVDLALMLEPEKQPDFSFVPLFSDELRLIVERSHPWAQLGRAPREQLAATTLILANHTTQTFRLIEDYFRTERVQLTRYIEMGSFESMKELVKHGLGVGVMAAWTIDRELSDGELVSLPIGPRQLRRQWGICCLRGRRLSLAEETCIKLCRDATRTLDVDYRATRTTGSKPRRAASFPTGAEGSDSILVEHVA